MIGHIADRRAGRLPALLMLAGAAIALTGCGGGGGGGGVVTPTTVAITGTLRDSITNTPLPGRIVKIQGTSLQATADSTSTFTFPSVTLSGTQTFAVYESNGTTLDGTKAINLDAIGVTSPGGVPTKVVGTIAVPASLNPPPPPGI